MQATEGIVRAECATRRYEVWFNGAIIGTYASARSAANAYSRAYETFHAAAAA